MKLESQRYGSLVESYNVIYAIAHRTEEQSKEGTPRCKYHGNESRTLSLRRSLRYHDVMMDIDLPEREFNPSDRCDLFLLLV